MSEHQIFVKCAWRLIPFTALLYLVNYIDRTNVGFAALTRDRSESVPAFVILAGLSHLPAPALGPIVEHFMMVGS